jgi:hypothetical protein
MRTGKEEETIATKTIEEKMAREEEVGVEVVEAEAGDVVVEGITIVNSGLKANKFREILQKTDNPTEEIEETTAGEEKDTETTDRVDKEETTMTGERTTKKECTKINKLANYLKIKSKPKLN